MEIIIDKKKYLIKWKHHNLSQKFKHNKERTKTKIISYREKNKFYGTYCNIMNEKNITIAQGKAILSLKDNFNKSIGRKESLTKALGLCPFNKKQRIKIWKQYFNTIKKPKPTEVQCMILCSY